MASTGYYYYHPFENVSLGFLIENQLSSDKNGFEIDDIDLYYQPVEHPAIGIVFLTLKLILFIIGAMVNVKVLVLLKKENSILMETTTLLIWTQIIFYPVGLIFITSTDFIHPIYKIFGHWFCTLMWLFMDLCSYIIIFYSFFAASIRYFFIVHYSTAKMYGKEKIKNIFLFLYILIPCLCVLWQVPEELHHNSYINKCYGKDHNVFLIETSSLEVLKHRFWESKEFEVHGIYDISLALARRISKILRSTVILVMGSNIIEGLLYYKILTHIYR